MNVVLTGGSGFLGKHVQKACIASISSHWQDEDPLYHCIHFFTHCVHFFTRRDVTKGRESILHFWR